MKRILLVASAVLLTASMAQASLVGSWSEGEAVGSYTRYILTVTPTAGENMNGFNMVINLPGAATTSTGFAYAAGGYFGDSIDSNTHFLFNASHIDEMSEESVTDLLPQNMSVTSKKLAGMFYRTTNAGAAYADGWSSALQVAELVVKSSSFTVPENLTYGYISTDIATSTGGKLMGRVGTSFQEVTFVPEPGTIALLASGLVGLLAYAWRKRKQ